MSWSAARRSKSGNGHYRPKAWGQLGTKQHTIIRRWHVLDHSLEPMKGRRETEPQAEQQRVSKIRGINQKVMGLLQGSEQRGGRSIDVLEADGKGNTRARGPVQRPLPGDSS